MNLGALLGKAGFGLGHALVGLGLQILHFAPHLPLPFGLEFFANLRDLVVDQRGQADAVETLFLGLLEQLPFGRPQGDDIAPQAHGADNLGHDIPSLY